MSAFITGEWTTIGGESGHGGEQEALESSAVG
jgi:hypothetical protein